MKLTFDEGVALVTGGTGGIGSATVSRLNSSGVAVAFTYDRGKDAADDLLRTAARGPGLTAHRWSTSGFEDAAELARSVRREHGPVRYLVVASGIGQASAFHVLSEEAGRQLIETNLTAAISMSRAVVTSMMKEGSGRIVLVGSVSGSRGIRGHSVYAASKAGLEGFCRALARETGPFGVTVNCVAPGFVDTPMLDGVPPETRKDWIRRTPVGRLGCPEEIADMICFLLSREAGYVTGQTFVIDGGISL